MPHEFRGLLERHVRHLAEQYRRARAFGDRDGLQILEIMRAAIGEPEIEPGIRFEQPHRSERRMFPHRIRDALRVQAARAQARRIEADARLQLMSSLNHDFGDARQSRQLGFDREFGQIAKFGQ